MVEFIQIFGVFLATLAIAWPLMAKAGEIGLIDIPNARKLHDSPVPVVGGIAVVMAVSVGALGFGTAAPLWGVGISTWLLALCGMLDDRHNIRVSFRLLAQIMVAVILHLGAGVTLTNLGQLLPGIDVPLGAFAFPFTVFCVVGVINAVNMIDGLDGLSGSLVVISLTFIAMLLGEGEARQLALMGIGGLVGFLVFNARVPGRQRALIFLGDAGSTVLGLWLAYLLIVGSQGPSASFPPVAAAWFLGIPLIDASSVIIKRALLRRPLFGADKGHLHHYLLDLGLSVNRAVGVLVAAQIALGLVGLLITRNPALQPAGFWAFLAVVALVVSGTLEAQRERALPDVEESGQRLR